MISIDKVKCTACGICGITCPRHIPETIAQVNKKVTIVSTERLNLCMECGLERFIMKPHLLHQLNERF